MTVIIDGADRRLQFIPAPLVVERATDQCRQERAARASAEAGIELGHQLIRKLNVQTHVRNIAHAMAHGRTARFRQCTSVKMH
jgi:hypothetical protein